MHRVSIIGCSGSGKSTLAMMVQQRAGLPWLELDALYHQPDWTPLDTIEFRRRVSDFLAREQRRVIDGNYQAVADLIHMECTDLVWSDLSLPRILSRLAARSVRRAVTRTVLWNGNQERLRDLCSLDPKRSMLSWAVKTHRLYQARFETMQREPHMSHVKFHRLESPQDVARWMELFIRTSSRGTWK